MAVDYFHRLIVTGPREPAGFLRHQLRRRIRRSIAGEGPWRETVAFSFERLYQLVPTAVRIEPVVPCDPFDVRAWPIRRLPHGEAELRYQLHTRNVDLLPFVRLLSRKFPPLTFYLVTFCLDDSVIVSYRMSAGRIRTWVMPQSRREVHWEHARQEFGLEGDSVYDDDAATYFAEAAMLEEAMDHWQPGSASAGQSRKSDDRWWNQPVTRDFMMEKQIALVEGAEGYQRNKRGRPAKRDRTTVS